MPPSSCASCSTARGRSACACRRCSTRPTATRSRSPISHSSRATWKWSSASRRSSAGTRWRWWFAPTARTPSWAATSRAMRRRPTSSRWASTTSSAPGRRATSSTSSRTRRPGVYSRAFLEGRIAEEQLDNYRREVGGRGLSSYCHPWLMASFWQFPTGSMGLGPINAIYQARFMRYLEDRGVLETDGRKVWCFVGDGEMDEPEALAGLSLAAREGLDNLIFVVNCNLQRLDGPVRGNGSIVQELEGLFAGAGWNVIKVLWGSDWDPLFARDQDDGDPEAAARDGRRRVPDLRCDRRALQPRALLQQVSGAAGARRPHDRRGHRPVASRRARSGEDLRRVPHRRCGTAGSRR